MFPIQVTATPADTALSQGEYRDPTMLQRITGLLREPQERMKQQEEDSHAKKETEILTKKEPGGGYVADDNALLWYVPQGSILRLAIPRSLVPGILALVHTTYGQPGVARITELVQRKYHWTSLRSNIRDCMLSCKCRMTKRSTSQRVAMLPARFLKLWGVLEMDIHDMGARSEAGNKYLLVVVDRSIIPVCLSTT